MGKFIVKIKDYYLEWSTIVDSPITFGMQKTEFIDYYRDEYGRQGIRGLQARLDRAEEKGTSSLIHDGLDDLIKLNRAGPNEDELTLDEIYEAYCLRKPIRNGWTVPEYPYGDLEVPAW